MKLAKHITLTHDGRLIIDGEAFGYYLADEPVTVESVPGLARVTVTILAEAFDCEATPKTSPQVHGSATT